jgi:hypothetical protein
VSEDAGIEPRTVATSALAVRQYKLMSWETALIIRESAKLLC